MTEFKEYVRKLKIHVYLSAILLYIIILCVAVALAVLSTNWILTVCYLCITILAGIVFAICQKQLKKPENNRCKPFVIQLDKVYTYDMLYSILANAAKNKDVFSESDGLAFFRFKNKFFFRTILFFTADFNKKDYDSKKSRINRKANKLYHISQWVRSGRARKTMRVNIVLADYVNNALDQYISTNAAQYLTRVEGILNLVICKDKLIVPPLYDVSLSVYALQRYAGVVSVFTNLLN